MIWEEEIKKFRESIEGVEKTDNWYEYNWYKGKNMAGDTMERN